MRLLQWYILKELLKVFTVVLCAVTVLLVFVGVFREATENGLGPAQILQVLPFVIPSLLPFTIPATMLLTVCVVFGRMSGDQEITAAKAAGINIMSLMWPSLFLGGFLSATSLILTDQVIPWAVDEIQQTVVHSMEDIFFDRLKSQLQFVDRKRGIAITVRSVEDRKLIKPTFRYTPPGGKTVTLQADEATLRFDLENQQVILHLVHGYFDNPGKQQGWIDDDEYILPLPIQNRDPKARNIPIKVINHELEKITVSQRETDERQAIETAFTLTTGDFERFAEKDFERIHWQAHADDSRTRRLRTEKHSRYALAFSCFMFVLVGSPFSILQGRRQFLTSFILCFIPIVLLYYPMVMLMMNQSKTGVLNPSWAMWVANGVMFVIGIYLLRRVRQH